MNFLTIFKLLATLLLKLSEYLKEQQIRKEIAKEAQDEIEKQIIIADTARDDAYLLPVDADPANRDNKKDNSV